MKGDSKTLFCPGIPGARKTILATIVVDYLQSRFQSDKYSDHKTGIAYVYCIYDKHKRQEQSKLTLLSTLLRQLIEQLPIIPKLVKDLYEKKKFSHLTFAEVSELLKTTARSEYSQVFIVLDALDEGEGDAHAVISEIRDLQSQSKTRLMATSRPIPEISQRFKDDINLEISAMGEDIERYLDVRLPSFVREKRELLHLAKRSIVKAVSGV